MKLIEVAQNSKEWRAWRDKGLGASVAGTIMGCNPYGSKFELALELTGACERAAPNEFAAAAMRRGTELEPQARELVEKELGIAFPSICAEHDDYPFIRASPDGFNADHNHGLEIKCPGKEAHAAAIKGAALEAEGKYGGLVIPKHYYAQVMQQMLVTGAPKWTYASWDGKSAETVKVTILRDDAYIAELLKALTQFWSQIQMGIMPTPTPKDLKAINARLADATKRMAQAQKALALYVESV